MIGTITEINHIVKHLTDVRRDRPNDFYKAATALGQIYKCSQDDILDIFEKETATDEDGDEGGN